MDRPSTKKRAGILIAVQPAPLSRVIEHILYGRQEFEIVGRRRRRSTLAQSACELRPELIIVNMRLLGPHACQVLLDLKTASPRSRLLVTGFVVGFAEEARRCGADVYLEEDHLVKGLMPTARRLLRKQGVRQKRAASKPSRNPPTRLSGRPGHGRDRS